MSQAFSNTTLKNGIIQSIERNLYGDDGDGRITGDELLFARFTADVNLAMDKVLNVIFDADGTWQFDDSNHTDYPIITRDLVASRRDYTFVSDESGNLILDVYKVFVADENGIFTEIDPVDVQSDSDTVAFTNGNEATGTPIRYDKTANGIFLDPVPNYSRVNSLKVYINREGSYFTVSDTTKKPGFAGLFHKYLAIEPSYNYAALNGLSNAGALQIEMVQMEEAIRNYYRRRISDERKRLSIAQHSNK